MRCPQGQSLGVGPCSLACPCSPALLWMHCGWGLQALALPPQTSPTLGEPPCTSMRHTRARLLTPARLCDALFPLQQRTASSQMRAAPPGPAQGSGECCMQCALSASNPMCKGVGHEREWGAGRGGQQRELPLTMINGMSAQPSVPAQICSHRDGWRLLRPRHIFHRTQIQSLMLNLRTALSLLLQLERDGVLPIHHARRCNGQLYL